ncbi:MAG: DNA internalization-related competence protein ComEC/Rec2 [Gemmatimonadaceae bacterium]
MPLVVWLFVAYAVGLWLGFGGLFVWGGTGALTLLLVALRQRRSTGVLAAATLVLALLVSRDAVRVDAECQREALRAGRMVAELLIPLRPGASAAARSVVCGTRVRVSGGRTTIAAGTVVDVHGTFRRSTGGLRVQSARLTVLRAPTVLLRARARVSATMDRLFERDAPLARALVLAEQYDLPSELRTRYADAGIIHMVSVSGLHVSIIAGGLLATLGAVGLPLRAAQGLALAVLAAYVVFIGAPPPAVRSAAMTGLTIGSRWVQRHTSPWSIWAVGSGVSLVEPRIAIDLGWQLSVCGMAGLIASGGLCERLMPALSGWRKTIGESVIATGVATVVSAPIVAWTFGRISLAAVITNLLAAPLFNIAQPLLFVSVLLSWSGPVAGFLSDATRGALWLIGLVAQVGAAVPFGVVAVAPTATTAIGVATAAAAIVVACAARRWQRPAALALGALLVIAWRPLLPHGSGALELHMLDVGQGDALAIRSPRGRWLLVDAGGSWRSGDAGGSVVAPYLRRFGGDVVYLAMSHPHADHVGGVRSLIGAAGVDTVWDTGFPGTSPAYREALDSVIAGQAAWRRVTAGDTVIFDGVTVSVLGPDRHWLERQHNPNEASLVLLVQFGEVRLLLMGDAESGEERWLLERLARGGLRADVLKAGHHGSGTSSTPALLDAVRPRVALISVGADNDYGHPSPDVLRALDARRIHVLRTDDEGTIMLSTDGVSIDIRSHDARWHFSRDSLRH